MGKKNILITGGAGFIGSHVADYLVGQGHNVTILDDLSGGYLENVNNNAKFVKGSINDCELVKKVMRKKEIVYHMAAYAAEGLSHFVRNFNYQNNVIGSMNLINEAIRNDIEKFLFTSSLAVYGSGKPPFDENMKPSPEDPYGISKFAVELDLRAAKEMFGLKYVIIRPHNVYGERQNIGDPYRNAVGIFMNRVMLGLPPLIYGDGKQTRAFSYIGDVAPYIAKAPFIEKANGEIINLGSKNERSLNELAEIIIKSMGSNLEPIHTPPRFEVKHAYCTTKKSEKILGFRESVSLEGGIQIMAKWARDKGPMNPLIWNNYELTKKLPEFWKNLRRDYKKAN